MRVLICGGGVIGACVAYFLSRRGAKPVVIERTNVACAASGKSGGFLALDWCDGTPLAALARRSFALHAALADELGGDWHYRRLATYSGWATAHGGAGRRDSGPAAWLANDVVIDRRLGSPETTAQVHPAAFTAAMMRAAEGQGATLRRGAVTGVVRAAHGDRVRPSTAARSSKATPSSSPWGRGRSWRRAGCRFPASMASRDTA
jgi:glycine/D-amino acid oxidase-like deaminating enzyme